jgi:hypothetical protein
MLRLYRPSALVVVEYDVESSVIVAPAIGVPDSPTHVRRSRSDLEQTRANQVRAAAAKLKGTGNQYPSRAM